MSEKLTPAGARALFPAVRRAAYLNAAAASPLAEPVEQAASAHLIEARDFGDVGFGAWLRRKEAIRAGFGRLIGAKPEEVAFLASTSMGFFVVGQLLRERGVSEVVTLEQEFPSTTLPLLHAGFALRVVRPEADGGYPVEAIEAALSPRTGAIALSAVQYATGFRVDLAAVGRLCRDRGLLLAVNGAQALGQVPLDVRALGIDFLCGTSHKWMMGGYGVGLFFAREALLSELRLPFAGWLSTEHPMEMQAFAGAAREESARWFVARGAAVRKDAAALEVGCGPFTPLLGFGAAVELIERVGVEAIEAHNAGLQRALRSRLRARGFAPSAPDDPKVGSGICGFPVRGDPAAVVRELARRGVVVSARGGGVRVSTHVFNAEEDLDRLFAALEDLGEEGSP